MINLSTGPVVISGKVIEALNSPVLSHRSSMFIQLHNELSRKLCAKMDAKECYIMTGSGTMANDAMLYQIKALNKSGIILVNGEFGDRLRKQAERLNIQFTCIDQEWGKEFNAAIIEQQILDQKAEWMLCCHCETSTGTVIDLNFLKNLSIKYRLGIYLDCMSTFGTMPISLDNVAMATASTAKGIGSLSGLAIVFSNINLIETDSIPIYLDLFHMQSCKGVPFTISSNLVAGLNAAIDQNMLSEKWEETNAHLKLIYQRLHPLGLIPFSNESSRVFTLVLKRSSAEKLGKLLEQNDIKTSYESNYLVTRNWLQLALFSTYTTEEIEYALSIIEAFLLAETKSTSKILAK